MYPETVFKHKDQAFRVWSTKATHLGFDAGYTRGNDNDVPPVTINTVDYQVRFDANLQDDGTWALKGETNYGGTWVSYYHTVFISRAGWLRTGNNYEPTESGRKKLIALAHEVIAAFVASDEAAGLLATGQKVNAKMALDRAAKDLGEAKKALAKAESEFSNALGDAQDAGVDTFGILFKSRDFS